MKTRIPTSVSASLRNVAATFVAFLKNSRRHLAPALCLLAAAVIMPQAGAANIIKTTAGAWHSLFLYDDGALWAMGGNDHGQLGDKSTTDRSSPVKVADGVSDVAAGEEHSLFVKTDGTLWAMGKNEHGQLGVSGTNSRSTPVQVATGVRAVAAGAGYDSHYSLFIKTDNTLWLMGGENYRPFNTPVQVADDVKAADMGGSELIFLKHDGTLWIKGSYVESSPWQVASDVKALAAGNDHFLFVKNNGTLWGRGTNYYGQLSETVDAWDWVSDPVQIATGVNTVAAGGNQSLFVKNDGTLWGMGWNICGALGDGTNAPQSTPTQMATGVSAAAVGGAADVDGAHSLFVKNNSALWAAGHNGRGQLGDSTTTNRYTPVFVAGTKATGEPSITKHPASQAITIGGNVTLTVTASGSNLSYQWRKDGANIAGATGASHAITNTQKTHAGAYTVIASNPTGSVTSEAAILTAPPQTTTAIIIEAAASYGHSLYLTDDGTLWGMGDNSCGQLGDGTTTRQRIPVQVATNVIAFAAGEDFSLFVKNDGTLWGMGYVRYDEPIVTTPKQIATGIKAVATGYSYDSSLILKTDDSLYFLGGVLGHGWVSEPIATNVKAVAGDYWSRHSLFIKNDGSLWGMGHNYEGQLGLGGGADVYYSAPVQIANDVAAIALGDDYSLFVKTDGSLWATGRNGFGQLGDGTTTNRSTPVRVANGVSAVAAGYPHSLFIKTDGSLWGMGANFCGELGDGTNVERKTPVKIASGVKAVAAGFGSSLFVKTNGSLWAMGWNGFGQLGNGTITNQHTPVHIVGTNPGGSGPVITTHPADASVPVRSLVTFGVIATGSGLSYQWQKSGSNISNATSNSYTISQVQKSDEGGYRAIVSNASGTAISNAATLIVTGSDNVNSGGGGGAPSLLWLGALAALAALRRASRR